MITPRRVGFRSLLKQLTVYSITLLPYHSSLILLYAGSFPMLYISEATTMLGRFIHAFT